MFGETSPVVRHSNSLKSHQNSNSQCILGTRLLASMLGRETFLLLSGFPPRTSSTKPRLQSPRRPAIMQSRSKRMNCTLKSQKCRKKKPDLTIKQENSAYYQQCASAKIPHAVLMEQTQKSTNINFAIQVCSHFDPQRWLWGGQLRIFCKGGGH